MTISNASNTAVVQGNGVTTSFDFSFPVPLASELFVYYTDTTGAQTLLPSSQYSVTGIGTANGGSITYPLSGSPIAIGTSLTLQRVVPYVQLTDLVNQSGYYPNVVENALDYLTMQTQQLAAMSENALEVPLEATQANLLLPTAAARANHLVGFDASGNAVTYPISASVGAGNLTSEGPFVSGTNFTPGVTTSLTLSQAYGTVANVQVHFDGVYQGTDQYSLNGTQITFTSPIPVGVSTVYIVGGTTLTQGTVPAGSVGTSQLQNGAVTAAKIAAGAVGATQLGVHVVGDGQLAWGSVLNRVVDSIAALRALSKTVYSRAFVTGYTTIGDGGGGNYWLNAADTTSADNGGTIIVATDGGRWYLQNNGAVFVEQFGAKGDGLSDDANAIQSALNNAKFGGIVYLSPKPYRVASGITVPNGIGLKGIGVGSYASGSINDSSPLIIGDLSVSVIVTVTSGGYGEGVAAANFMINRAAGTVPSGSVGLLITNSANNITVQDILVMRSNIGIKVGRGADPTSLGVHLLRVQTTQIPGYHIQIENAVGVTIDESYFGRNGGADVSSTGYVNILGATVDTVKFFATQFNLSGGTATYVIDFTGYQNNANGIISFQGCHMEQWLNLIHADVTSSNIRSLSFMDNTIDSGSGNIFYGGPAAMFKELMVVGNRLDGGFSTTLDQMVETVFNGNRVTGTVLVNAGTQVMTGNFFVGAVTLQGATSRTVFVGNGVAGGLGNTMTGTTSIANNI